jgi:hypothetical protein
MQQHASGYTLHATTPVYTLHATTPCFRLHPACNNSMLQATPCSNSEFGKPRESVGDEATATLAIVDFF